MKKIIIYNYFVLRCVYDGKDKDGKNEEKRKG